MVMVMVFMVMVGMMVMVTMVMMKMVVDAGDGSGGELGQEAPRNEPSVREALMEVACAVDHGH